MKNNLVAAYENSFVKAILMRLAKQVSFHEELKQVTNR